MAGRGRPKVELTLSDVEREALVRWSRRRKSAQALALLKHYGDYVAQVTSELKAHVQAVAEAAGAPQVGGQANHRYLTALGDAQRGHGGRNVLHRLCQPRVNRERRHSGFNPVARGDTALFRAVLAGEHTITGFRNNDIAARLYPTPPANRRQAKHRCQRRSRLIAKLRGHGLIAKVPHRRLYRTTSYGHRVMAAALAIHDHDFPVAYTTAQGP